jgi:hypothetical protein
MDNTRAFLRAHAQHDTDTTVERRAIKRVHLASLSAVLYKCNMDDGNEMAKLRDEIAQLKRAHSTFAFEAGERLGEIMKKNTELCQERDQLRADSALVVRALDCALVLINGLILFLPHGMVQPPELGGMKQQLDEAMAMIRRREAAPDLPPGMVASSMAAANRDRDFETAFLLETGGKVIEKLQSDKLAMDRELQVMGVLLEEKTAEIERVTNARNIACYNITELTDQKAALTGVLTDALTLVEYMIGELRNNNVMPSAALQVAKKQFDEKMRRLLKLNRDMQPQ